jgi:hypothetical protein
MRRRAVVTAVTAVLAGLLGPAGSATASNAAVNIAPTRIVVELIPGAAPITGRVLAPAQESRPFTGWTGLFAALRAAAANDGCPNGRPDPQAETR